MLPIQFGLGLDLVEILHFGSSCQLGHWLL